MTAERTWGTAVSLGLPAVDGGPLEACPCVTSAVVHGGPGLQVTAWRCMHDGPALRSERHHTHVVLSVLRIGACEIVEGRWRRTLDPAAAVVHRPGATYRTRHPHGLGDAGFSLAFSAESVRGLDLTASRPSTVHPVVPSTAVTEAWITLHRLRLGRPVCPLEAEEQGLRLLEAVLGTEPVRSDPSTHARLADRARAVLAARFREPIRVTDVASALNCSPFHLCRVFRAQTGTTLARWLLHRRVLAAVHALDEADQLADLAQRCGFASHAHLTDRVRDLTGQPPSVLRSWVQAA